MEQLITKVYLELENFERYINKGMMLILHYYDIMDSNYFELELQIDNIQLQIFGEIYLVALFDTYSSKFFL